MKVIILTGSKLGTAAHHLPKLIESGVCDIAMVVVSIGEIKNKRAYRIKKLRKLLKVGLFGALNGIRMRKWYTIQGPLENIEDICKKNNVLYHETSSINCDTTVKLFQGSNAELGISLGNSYIGKKVFSSLPEGMINIHHEVLPDYKNAQSVIWQLYNNSTQTGYTIHQIDEHIDNGSILYQEQVPIHFGNTLEQCVNKTYNELLNASAKGLLMVLKDYLGYKKKARVQGKGGNYTTPNIWQFIKIKRNYKALAKKTS